jgi:N-acetyltransferase
VSGRQGLPPAEVTLQGDHVRIEPLGLGHVPRLAEATAGDEEVWRWLPAFPADEAELRTVVEAALAERARGQRFPFAILTADGSRVLGSSSYLDFDSGHPRIEIGWTWLSRQVWRSPVNTEAKLLLLSHAFEDLGYERVTLKTHHLNERSQAAIARLGAVREGTLRHHVRHRDGSWRDSVYYSILSAEWPQVREGLRARLTPG